MTLKIPMNGCPGKCCGGNTESIESLEQLFKMPRKEAIKLANTWCDVLSMSGMYARQFLFMIGEDNEKKETK